MKTSFSAMSVAAKCDEAYVLKYRDGLRPAAAMGQFEPGSMFHGAIEHIITAHANGAKRSLPRSEESVRVACEKMRERRAMTFDAEEHAQQVMRALDYHVPRMDLDQWETIWHKGKPAVELELAVDFHGTTLQAHIDWVARSRRTGKVWIIDHKTSRNRLSQQPWVENDLQLALYKEACRIEGIEVDGGLLHQVCITPPNKVEPLKRPRKADGRRFSSAKNLRTDWETYSTSLIEHGEDPDAYQDMREMLDNATERQPFRRWTPDVTTPEGHANLIVNAKALIRKMYALKTGARAPVASRVNEWTCGRCEFRPLCDAKFAGRDYRSLIGALYTPDEDSPYAGYSSDDTSALKENARRMSNTGRYDTHGFRP